MSIKLTSLFKEQTPTLVLLLIIALIVSWYFLSGLAAQAAADVPVVSLITGIVLVVVGFAAGVLGGLIDTKGTA